MKRTAKHRVLKRYPRAHVVRDGWDVTCGFFDYAIYKNKEKGWTAFLGSGPTAAEAWKDATTRLYR